MPASDVSGPRVESTNASIREDGIDLFDLLLYILRAKLMVMRTTIAFAIFGIAVALWLRPYFTATAVIMPPQQEQSSMSALAGQLGSMGSLGAASALGLKNPGDMYVGMLQSEGIANQLVTRFQLQDEYKARMRVDARQQLKKATEFEAAKDGLIYIKVRDRSPNKAAQMANAYVEELYELNSKLAIGQAAQRRVFFKNQLDDERRQLADAEEALKNTEEKTGVIQLTGQADQIIRNIASLKAQIASREVELGVAHTFATDQNPDVAELEQQIAGLKKQVAILESTQGNTLPGDVQVPSGRVPEAGLDYLRKMRDVRYHESLLELLSKQFEAASLDEEKSSPQIEVVDPAQPPERKTGPSRTLTVLGFTLAGFALALLWALVRGVLNSMPSYTKRFEDLREALRSPIRAKRNGEV